MRLLSSTLVLLTISMLSGCETSSGIGSGIILLTLGVIAVWLVRSNRGPHDQKILGESPRSHEPVVAPNHVEVELYKVDYVREQVRAHRELWLSYQVGLRAIEADLTKDELASLLKSKNPELGAPVLKLFHDDWMWRRGEQAFAVQTVAGELGLELPVGSGRPTDLLCDTIRDWARAEAKRMVEECLKLRG